MRTHPSPFGETVSHTLYRYPCQQSHYRDLPAPSRVPVPRRPNAPRPRPCRRIRSVGGWLKPRYIFGAGRLN
ncbi:hypothetical protein WCLP8_3900001 [uncultured Gammaproteobacteria bacterium]